MEPQIAPPIEIFLHPGEFCLAKAGYRIRTLLGSCVAITLWHRAKKLGAMSHFLLASRAGQSNTLDGHYGNEALWLMLRELVRFDINPAECEAKLFGGGNMFPDEFSNVFSVGTNNGEVAREILRAYNVKLTSESLYGNGHREVIFDIESGDVWVRQPEQSASTPYANRDEQEIPKMRAAGAMGNPPKADLMKASIDLINRCAKISLQGRFDFNGNHIFKNAYEPLLHAPEINEIEIDLDAVRYLDSSALGMLLLLKERAELIGKSVALSNCRGTIRDILDIANFMKLFKAA